MDQRFFHGNFSSEDLADCLIIHFNRGNLKVQKIGQDPKVAVQIATSQWHSSRGDTALSVFFQNVEDGISVQMGQQSWFGIAASLSYTALTTLRNPFNLLGRLDDLAQDIEYLRLSDEVWRVLESNVKGMGTGYELSERLHRYVCEYCNVANPPGEPACIACGAPLGNIQPISCNHCGFVLQHNESICPNCRNAVENKFKIN